MKRNIFTQYKKVKNYLLQGKFNAVNFKIRYPKQNGIYYFRINKQFRARGFLDNDILKIYKIDNHQ